ncbi:MAG: type II secretion system F family protein [Myxococcota bacterium]
MRYDILALKYGCLLAISLAVGITAVRLFRAPDSMLRLHWLRYVHNLDESFSALRVQLSGSRVANAQAIALPILAALALLLRLDARRTAVLVALVLFTPTLLLAHALRKRRERIERDTNGFLIGLANSLKASPSLGKALGRVETVLSGPLATEISEVTRDIRLGAGVDQALLALGARVKSPALDSALTGILIGRQVGGNLPEILETTASTLREMERLEGVVRSKTAEGKAQVVVIALAPPIVFLAFDTLQHGYFDPFTASLPGMGLLAFACILWVGAAIMAKHILTVDV